MTIKVSVTQYHEWTDEAHSVLRDASGNPVQWADVGDDPQNIAKLYDLTPEQLDQLNEDGYVDLDRPEFRSTIVIETDSRW